MMTMLNNFGVFCTFLIVMLLKMYSKLSGLEGWAFSVDLLMMLSFWASFLCLLMLPYYIVLLSY